MEEVQQGFRQQEARALNSKDVSRPKGKKKAPLFSLLHAAAITGDKAGLQKLASGNFCDIDLVDKVCLLNKFAKFNRPLISFNFSLAAPH